MKNTKLLLTATILILFPLFLTSQNYQLDEAIDKINQVLVEYPSNSSEFGIMTTVEYSLELNINEVVVKEKTTSSVENQVKEYFITFNDIKFQGVIVNAGNNIINIKYSEYGTDEHYFKYSIYGSDGKSEGLEPKIHLYLGNINDEELDVLVSQLNNLFSNISNNQYTDSGSQSSENDDFYKSDSEPDVYDEYYTNNDEEDDDYSNNDYYSDYNYNDKNYSGNSNSDNSEEIEYYNEDGIRVYSESEAYFYRTIKYDKDGIQTVIDFIGKNTPYMLAQIKYRDPNNRNKDIYNGKRIWFYENGDVHFIAFYKDGVLEGNQYVEFDEQGTATLIFTDDFNDNRNKWTISNKTDIFSTIESGFLYVESKNNYKIPMLIKYKIDQDEDFILESKFKLVSGDNNSGQGIIWGFKDWDNYFSFIISDDGYYEIFAYNDGLRFDLSDKWVKSDYIKQNNEWNKLQLNKYDDKIIFSINSHIVKKTDFYSFKGNNIGFFVGPNRKIKIDHLTVKQKLDISDKSGNEGTEGFGGGDGDLKGTGSGIVLTTDGYIVTNYHVAGEANKLAVAFYKNNERVVYYAEYVIGDKEHDLAIIKINDAKFSGFSEVPYYLKTDDSDLGERVFTLGYPFASEMGAEIIFNEGTISSQTGLGRDDVHYQISVPVQPGNSGGPLFDTKGNLIGIVDSRTEEIHGRPAENIAYAIKTYYVRRLINKLPKSIKVPNSYTTSSMETTNKIKILKEFIPIIFIY